MCVLALAGSLAGAVDAAPPVGRQTRFSFAPYLDPNLPNHTLGIGKVVIDGRRVQIEGGDSARPTGPFLFEWGDGETTESGFTASHTYARAERDYVVKVTARYRDGKDTVTARVRFVPRQYTCQRREAVPRRVFIPQEETALGSTMPGYTAPEGVTCFRHAELRSVPREVIEYVLDVGHDIQMDLCNRDVTKEAATRQVVLKQTCSGGCGSLWFADPVALVCHPDYLSGEIGFSSLLHELAHNLTLNSPAGYRFGGKTDGPMNAIVSETLAQIFQHATIHEILNSEGRYGLSEDLCQALQESGVQSIEVVRGAYRRYLADPRRCTTYNDPNTPEDETFNTFMTVAYTFCSLAEERADYRAPLKRMMRLMQTFCAADRERFQQRENESFRSTFLVAAMSYGFDQDLREKFRKLSFPVSDELYAEFLARMSGSMASSAPTP